MILLVIFTRLFSLFVFHSHFLFLLTFSWYSLPAVLTKLWQNWFQKSIKTKPNPVAKVLFVNIGLRTQRSGIGSVGLRRLPDISPPPPPPSNFSAAFFDKMCGTCHDICSVLLRFFAELVVTFLYSAFLTKSNGGVFKPLQFLHPWETPCFSWVFNFAGEVWSYSLLWQNVKYTLTGCLISISIRNKAFVFAKLLSFLHTFFATFLFHHITLTIHHIARKLFGSSCSELLILWVFREELFSVAVNLCQELTFKITYS